MSPIIGTRFEPRAHMNISYFAASDNEFRQQWIPPTNVLSVLLIRGGDVVNKVVAQAAAITCALSGDWSNLFITFGGTLLALVTGSLPEWKNEKWPVDTAHIINTFLLV